MSDIVKQNVKAYIASYANYPTADIKDEHVLKNAPLKLDDSKLTFLAMALRAYVKSYNPDKTILATELRKKDFDVKKTYDLVIKNIT